MSAHIDAFKDSTVLIRGANHATVNKILSKIHFDFEPKTWLKAPAMALVLEHIYGVQTSDRRHSIIYMHFSMNPEQLKAELGKTSTGTKASSMQDMIETHSLVNPNLNMVLP